MSSKRGHRHPRLLPLSPHGSSPPLLGRSGRSVTRDIACVRDAMAQFAMPSLHRSLAGDRRRSAEMARPSKLVQGTAVLGVLCGASRALGKGAPHEPEVKGVREIVLDDKTV